MNTYSVVVESSVVVGSVVVVDVADIDSTNFKNNSLSISLFKLNASL